MHSGWHGGVVQLALILNTTYTRKRFVAAHCRNICAQYARDKILTPGMYVWEGFNEIEQLQAQVWLAPLVELLCFPIRLTLCRSIAHCAGFTL